MQFHAIKDGVDKKILNKSYVVSRKYATAFATLVLVQNVGGAYMWDATILSHDYALPSDKA